jgi:Zn-dependent peptidase ImmA (M78 family)
MGTNLARAKTVGRRWYKPIYTLKISDGYELALFVFMHELYHLLIKRARRNTRQKESRCDRFAARFLVDRFGATVRDHKRRLMPREAWDFQDVESFVAAARDRRAARRPIQLKAKPGKERDGQLLLFEL